MKFLFRNETVISSTCLVIGELSENDVKKIIDSWKAKLIYTSNFNSHTTFEKFLNSLSNIVLSAKLHPMILNTFWEQLSTHFCYEHKLLGIDYHYLYTTHNKTIDENLCQNITVSLDQLRDNI